MRSKSEFRKRDIFYLVPLWLLSLIAPDPYLYHKKEFKRKELFYLGAICFAPLVWSDPHFHHLMVLSGIYAILSLGLSLFMGFAGQISLGHAAFFGIGAYTTAILTTQYALPTIVAFGASAVSAAVIAYWIGKPLLKLKGYFLALATLGFGEIFLVIARESTNLTGGVIGIFGIPLFSVMGFSFDTYLKQYYLVWGVLTGLFVFSKNLVRSKVGRALLAVSTSEDAAMSVGMNVYRIKLEIFILGAAYAGLAGSLFSCVMSTANPDTFNLGLTVLIVMMVILGGMGNLYGPIAGAILLTWLTDLLSQYQEYSLPLYGVILILLLIFFPDGIGTRLNVRILYLIGYWAKKKRRDEGKI
ncbi:MAG: branched-chain amino acid ABC transporter permease [Syntrophaceae bacterium]|nr:branched-chain amino acid ABC transporter permease [Syntrophaceae bacterium]